MIVSVPEPPRIILQRLIEERREDYAGLSRLLGRNPAYVQQFIKRGTPRRLSETDRNKLARYFGVPETLLGAPDEPQPLIKVPRLDVRASAGPGAVTGHERGTGVIGFDERWLRRLAGGDPASLSMIQVEGDSMTPTLNDGDEIIVNRSEAGGGLRDGIYVLRVDELLLVKRLALAPDGRMATIRSDNPAYPTWPACDLCRLTIVGRVVWAGRRLG